MVLDLVQIRFPFGSLARNGSIGSWVVWFGTEQSGSRAWGCACLGQSWARLQGTQLGKVSEEGLIQLGAFSIQLSYLDRAAAEPHFFPFSKFCQKIWGSL